MQNSIWSVLSEEILSIYKYSLKIVTVKLILVLVPLKYQLLVLKAFYENYKASVWVQILCATLSAIDHVTTAIVTWNRGLAHLWSRMGTLQDRVVMLKSTARPMPTCIFNTTSESFQMRCCMEFCLKGH